LIDIEIGYLLLQYLYFAVNSLVKSQESGGGESKQAFEISIILWEGVIRHKSLFGSMSSEDVKSSIAFAKISVPELLQT
jgi:hypothetical protein